MHKLERYFMRSNCFYFVANGALLSRCIPLILSPRLHENFDFAVHGNALCSDYSFPPNFDDTEGLCTAQCSMGCPSVWRGRFGCDDETGMHHFTTINNLSPVIAPKRNAGCNTRKCNFDDGQCVQ